MEKRQRTRLASVLILLLVFGAGVVVGLAVDRTATAGPAPAETAEMGETGEMAAGDVDGDERRERRPPMYEQVGELTGEQQARIDSVVESFRARLHEMREAHEAESRPLREKWEARFDTLLEATRSDIKSVMTAEQAARYDSLVAEYDRKREERHRDRDDGDSRDDGDPRDD